MSKPVCTVEGCTNRGHRLCTTHRRWETSGKPVRPSLEDRFWARVPSREPGQCWKWMGPTRDQYGRFVFGRKMFSAHRVSYEIHNGALADGLRVYHSCGNPACVNPAHLWAGTHAESHAPFEQLFWAKVDKRGPEECWEWVGSLGSMGYGQIQSRSRSRTPMRSHRVAWELSHGRPVPAGMEVCHSCDNPPCVNPAHLWLGTHAENMRDMLRKGRGLAAATRKATG